MANTPTIESITRGQHAEMVRKLLAQRGLALPSDLIALRPRGARTELSFAQQRLWLLDQIEPNSAFYNTPVVLDLRGELDVGTLAIALNELGQRHEALRSYFPILDGEVEARTLPELDLTPTFTDVEALSGDFETQAQRIVADLVAQPFDLSQGPLARCALLRLAHNHHQLLFLTHHTVFDGWSTYILARDLGELYRAKLAGIEAALPPLTVQYGDFANWQRHCISGKQLQDGVEFWRSYLSGAPELTTFPSDRPRPTVQTFVGKLHHFSIDASCWGALQAFARAEGVTTFSVFMAAFAVLFSRHTGQDDVVTSTGIANRNRSEIEDLIGCFINIIPVRATLDAEEEIRSFVRRVHDSIAQGLDHQDVPFEAIVSAVRPKRDASYSPIAQTMIVFHNAGLGFENLPGLHVELKDVDKGVSQYDFLMHLRPEANGTVTGLIEYNSDLYQFEHIARISQQFYVALRSLIKHPGDKIAQIDILPPEEREFLLHCNVGSPKERNILCMHEYFEMNASRDPEHIALIVGQTELTYKDLDEATNRLAGYLISRGAEIGDTIAVCLDRSVEAIVSMIAIVKAGCAYLPIDPSYPAERVSFMLADSSAKLIIASSVSLSGFGPPCELIQLDDPLTSESVAQMPTVKLETSVTPKHPFYLIYTSGSTGKPKTIVLDHQGRVNNFFDFIERFGIGLSDRVLCVSSFSFDMSSFDIFGTLAAGGTIVLAETGLNAEPGTWAALMRSHGVTIWHSAPSLCDLLLDVAEASQLQFPELRLALLGGDWIPVTMPDRLHRISAGIEAISLGGATEASMDSTIYKIDAVDPLWKSIPYGRPMANQRAYILDDELQLCPIDVPGELYIAGAGVAWGYLGRSGLTAERFLPDPFGSAGDRMYRTGDAARIRPDGEIELLGRTDYQVKIHGLRVELGEIETALKAHECVNEAVVLASAEMGVVGFIVPPPDAHLDSAGILAGARKIIPEYMVPRRLEVLDKLPLSPNGKVDRGELQRIAAAIRPNTAAPPLEPITPLLADVQRLFADALGVSHVAPDDSFFDLGGDSFRAIRLIQKLPAGVSVLDLMTNATPRGIAKRILDGAAGADEVLYPIGRHDALNDTHLICTPYGGGSAIVYRHLARALAPKVRVSAVVLPGHEFNQTSETQSISTVAERCINALKGEAQPLAFYGHCAGAALTVELALRAEAAGLKVRGVFLGAALPRSDMNNPSEAAAATLLEAKDPVAAVFKFLGTIGDVEEMANNNAEQLARAFLHDSHQASVYAQNAANHSQRRRVSAPVTCIFADDDPLTVNYKSRFSEWCHIAEKVEIESLCSGGHYFINGRAEQVARLIRDRLEGDR